MGYKHIGGTHDFGDEPTEYGKGLSDKYDKSLKEYKMKAEKLYQEDLRIFEEMIIMIKQRNKHLETEYRQKLKKWEALCKNSVLGFFKKILKINKPRLKLLKIPEKPEWNYQEYMGKVYEKNN